MTEKRLELASFLKSRRDKLKPQQAGLPVGIRRRATGLRREEVAQIAGIGLTWYTWLEQGRDISVSHQVLESIAQALQLSPDERFHLFSLAGKTVTNDSQPRECGLTPAILNLLNHIEDIPAYIMDHRWNLLVWNPIAQKVFCVFDDLDDSQKNLVHLMFTHKTYMDLFDDWTFHARGVIARYRASYGKHPDDVWMRDFIRRLCERHPVFNEWWELYDIHGMHDIIKEITHPSAGKMSLEFISMDVSSNPHLKLIFHTPAPGTNTRKKLAMLRSGR